MYIIKSAIRLILSCLLAVLATTSYADAWTIVDTTLVRHDNCIVHAARRDVRTNVVFACFESDSGNTVAFVFDIRDRIYHIVVGGIALDDITNALYKDDPIVVRLRIGDHPEHVFLAQYHTAIQRAVAALTEDEWSAIAYDLASGSEQLIYMVGNDSAVRIPLYKYSIESLVKVFGNVVEDVAPSSVEEPNLN